LALLASELTFLDCPGPLKGSSEFSEKFSRVLEVPPRLEQSELLLESENVAEGRHASFSVVACLQLK
jgi:hypothetical protein